MINTSNSLLFPASSNLFLVFIAITISDFFQHQSKVSASLASVDLLSSSACIGADTLLKLLGNYCRNKDIKTTITVGIVGTGKIKINSYGSCPWMYMYV